MSDDNLRQIQNQLRTRAKAIGLDETDLHVTSMGETPDRPIDVRFTINVTGTVEQIEQLFNDAGSELDVARLAAERHLCRPGKTR
jgi:hypothetical protein